MKKLTALRFLFLLTIFIFLSSFLSIKRNTAYASTILFQDDFDSGNANQWTILNGIGLWQVKNINGNMMYGARINSSSTIIDSVALNLNSPNYQIDFDYLPVTDLTTSTVDRNLDFRYKRNSTEEQYSPYEVHFINTDSVWTNFGYPAFTSTSPLINNQLNHITIIVQNQHIQFILNGIKIIDYIDNLYQFTGDEKLGLRISTGGSFPTEVWFDNIVVTDLNTTSSPSPTPTLSINLDVPLLKQTSFPWQSQIYDNADKWSSSNPSINSWGCALTSAAMVLNYYGINKLPNGTSLNPGTLNLWLKSQKDGYIGAGWVNWLAISRLSKLAKSINKINAFDALEYSRTNNQNMDKLKNDLNNSIPDILEVPGHFIVAKGIHGNIININDPYYNRLTLNNYSNSFLSINTFTPSFTDLSYIIAYINPEINFTIKDSEGNQSGDTYIQKSVENDDNPTIKNKPLKFIYLPNPRNGIYTLTISSIKNINYELGIYFYNVNGEVKIVKAKEYLNKNKPDSFIINFDKLRINNNYIKRNHKQNKSENEIDDIKKWFENLFE